RLPPWRRGEARSVCPRHNPGPARARQVREGGARSFVFSWTGSWSGRSGGVLIESSEIPQIRGLEGDSDASPENAVGEAPSLRVEEATLPERLRLRVVRSDEAFAGQHRAAVEDVEAVGLRAHRDGRSDPKRFRQLEVQLVDVRSSIARRLADQDAGAVVQRIVRGDFHEI